jgi:transposase
MNLALVEFQNYVNPYSAKTILLMVDRAGWHGSKDLTVPANMNFEYLPPYTPELQPTECVWPLAKESIANRAFENLDELEAKLIPRCKYLFDHPQIVKGAVGFNWIQNIETTIN